MVKIGSGWQAPGGYARRPGMDLWARSRARWFERVSWWEAERRMPKGLSRVDVEVWQIQARLGRNSGSALTTMEIIRDGLGGGWRLREAIADAA